MTGFRTRGQPAAILAATAMIAAGPPHALLIVGPGAVGKTTLALDLAAALLCTAPDPADRPCRACRACRLVDAGNHPDLHRLTAEGPGGQITIGQVRNLVSEVSLLAMEGGARVVVMEGAQRMNDDAQNAFLKTLEEPPAGLTMILCADEEDRLLPTVRSRAARLRLGPLGSREIEELLVERGDADAATAAHLARLAGGRPGRAVALANAPDAVRARGEISRALLDLVDEGRARRLAIGRELLARAGEVAAALSQSPAGAESTPAARSRRTRGTAAASATAATSTGGSATARGGADSSDGQADPARADTDASATAEPSADEPAASRGAPAERRRNALALLEIWRDLTRDLALVGLGEPRGLHEPELLEELRDVAARTRPAAVAGMLVELDRAGQLIDANANPELAIDVLVLAWPRPIAAEPAARTPGAAPAVSARR